MNLFLSPHNDDEALYGAFTLLVHRPHVVVCFRGHALCGDPVERAAETARACAILGATAEQWWHVQDIGERVTTPEIASALRASLQELDARESPERVWAPSLRTSHAGHRDVGAAADAVFGDRVIHYHTYVGAQKVREGQRVPVRPEWGLLKHRALAEYGTQARVAHRWLMDDLWEWTE